MAGTDHVSRVLATTTFSVTHVAGHALSELGSSVPHSAGRQARHRRRNVDSQTARGIDRPPVPTWSEARLALELDRYMRPLHPLATVGDISHGLASDTSTHRRCARAAASVVGAESVPRTPRPRSRGGPTLGSKPRCASTYAARRRVMPRMTGIRSSACRSTAATPTARLHDRETATKGCKR